MAITPDGQVSVLLPTIAPPTAGVSLRTQVSSAHKGSSGLDKARLPSNLVVDWVWVPEAGPAPRRPIAYVGERRRRLVGAALIVAGVILAVAALVTRAAFWLAFVSLLVAWGGVAYAGGGQTGFYEVDEIGGLGRYLGRSRPEVGAMRRRKPWN